MLNRVRPHLTYANVMVTLLAFVVLGGVAYAAGTISSVDIVDGQVKTPDLAAVAVTTNKLAGGAATSDKVKDATLLGRDVADNALKGADIDESTLDGAAITGGSGGGGIARIFLRGAASAAIPLLPGLTYQAQCSGGPNIRNEYTIWFRTPEPGTANHMTIASGIDPFPRSGGPFEIVNGAQDGGHVLPTWELGSPAQGYFTGFHIVNGDNDPNSNTSAHSETQLIIDTAGTTYDISLHIYIREDGYCEASGTAIRAG